MSLFITGTGTGVGKTVVSAVVLAAWSERTQVSYWKPVATGAHDERDADTIRALCPQARVHPESHRYDEPVSPHLAARNAGERIQLRRLLADAAAVRSEARGALVVEGAGGVLVPLDDEELVLADLIDELGLPVLVVGSSGLGTINHTLLTLEALRARGAAVAGVVLVGERHAENRRAIERLGRTPLVLELERLARVDAASVAKAAAALDREGRVTAMLGARGVA